MEPVVDLAQPRLEHVRVDLRRRQIGVAEHQLNRAQVGPPLEQVRGERMAQHVRAQRARQSRLLAVAFEDINNTPPRYRPPPGGSPPRAAALRFCPPSPPPPL